MSVPIDYQIEEKRRKVIFRIRTHREFNETLDFFRERFPGCISKKTFKGEKDQWVWTLDYDDAITVFDEYSDSDSFSTGFSFHYHHKAKILALKDEKETTFIRRTFDESCMKYPPLGEYQLKGIKKIINQNRLMLNYEMRLGKSYVSISGLNYQMSHGLVDKMLYLCPPESLINFKREILKFNTVGITEEDIHITSMDDRKPFQNEYKIEMMTYNTFRIMCEDAYKASGQDLYRIDKKTGKKKKRDFRKPILPLEEWGTSRSIILDESQEIKNPQASQTKKILLHRHHFDYRYLLSGTPATKGVEDYFTQCLMMDDYIVGNDYNSFVRSIAKVGTSYSDYQIAYYYPEKIKKFEERASRWILKERGEDNLKLTELLVKPIFLRLTNKQRELYEALVTHTLTVIKEDNNGVLKPKAVEQKFPYMTQALEDPCLLKGKIDIDSAPILYNLVKKWKFEDNEKIPICKSLAKKWIEDEGRKIIIWSGHPETLERLKETFKKYNPVTIHGQIPIPKGSEKTTEKDKLLNEFRTNDKCKILLGSYRVIARAIEIVEATRVIYWDRVANLDFWLQSKKRNHGPNQKEDIITNPLIFEHTIEERVNEILEKNEQVDKVLFSKKSLDFETWKRIFNGEVIQDHKQIDRSKVYSTGDSYDKRRNEEKEKSSSEKKVRKGRGIPL
jgi:SNF2 family DNA or RNA helicase